MSCSGTCHSHINFTSRGKLLLIDVEKAKRDEFNRRRKLRLQQVRQQSNEIAREIRDRVKTEKQMKYTQDELKKQADLERWKEMQIKSQQDEFNRRFLIAEQDKENALKEVELAELEKKRQIVLQDIAKKRGNLAVLKQKREKLNTETESFLKTSNAKFNRSLENLRSALVASLPKPESRKRSSEERSSSETRFASPDKISSKYSEEGYSDKVSEVSDDKSVITLINGDYHQSRSPDRVSYPKSWIYSPEKRHHSDFPVSPKKIDKKCRSPSSRESFHNIQLSPYAGRKSKSSSQQIASQQTFNINKSSTKHPAGNVLMSPSKRVARSHCSHSRDSSPIRCDEFYCPNKYKDELDNSNLNRMRPRHVRFEDIAFLDGSEHVQCPSRQSRTLSEGNSEDQFESDVTWPPRKWNRHQEEEVVLYDHCGRSTSKYQPKHTVSFIDSQNGDEGLKEEMEACRERALRRHEETLRERRGSRAVYRQRLRAEFSCMISDLANLDKQTRLAKLESEAKSALLPKKQKKRVSKGNTIIQNEPSDNRSTVHAEKEDSPGRVQVMDCVETIDDIDSKLGEEITRQGLIDGHLDALDQLLAKLKEQRDQLLHQEPKENAKEEMGKNVQSVSVQCSVPCKSRGTYPLTEDEFVETDAITKESGVDNPVETELQEYDSCFQSKITSSHSEVPQTSTHPQVVETKVLESAQTQTSPNLENLVGKENELESIFLERNAESTLNDSKQGSQQSKSISDGSNSGTVDTMSCLYDGLKVEVKVSKSKTKKLAKKTKTQFVSPEKSTNETVRGTVNIDSWAKKLTENNSSTGTSYMSPPEELNPDEHKLLISVLEGMDKKNNNPILRMYIQRLLSMSKSNLENMSISVSDDSMKSEKFRSCFDDASVNTEGDNSCLLSYKTAQSNEESTQVKRSDSKSVNVSEAVIEGKSQPVKIILESEEGSLENQNEHYEKIRDEHFATGPQYIDTLSKYNERLKLLARMMAEKDQPSKKCFSVNDTSYLAIPSDLSGSIKLTESLPEVGLLKPEQSDSSDSKEDICLDSSKLPVASSWGVRSNILPKPHSYPERTVDKRPKPPSTINNYASRGVVLESTPHHELSAIAEVNSRFLNSVQPVNKNQPSTSTELGNLITKSSGSLEDKVSNDELYHTLPSTGFAISSETPTMSSSNVSSLKLIDESSLQIFTELPDSSFGQSSVEDVAVSEVFRSLGIGWALSTWRKTHEASRKDKETSTSSSTSNVITVSKKKMDEPKCRHSTPIKTSDAEKNVKILDSEDNKLTPPSVTLYQRYQNLIRSVSETSTSNDL